MKQQMEISFDGANPCRRQFRSQQRRNRARWWFDQMRSVVENAIDWKSAAPPRPEQMPLDLARHQ